MHALLHLSISAHSVKWRHLWAGLEHRALIIAHHGGEWGPRSRPKLGTRMLAVTLQRGGHTAVSTAPYPIPALIFSLKFHNAAAIYSKPAPSSRFSRARRHQNRHSIASTSPSVIQLEVYTLVLLLASFVVRMAQQSIL